jgi:hypothetical protein
MLGMFADDMSNSDQSDDELGINHWGSDASGYSDGEPDTDDDDPDDIHNAVFHGYEEVGLDEIEPEV